MKIILLQDIPKLGRKYEIKTVADGYAANFLLPKRLAETATLARERTLAAKQKEIEEERRVEADLLAKNLESLANVRVEITAKANKEGHLFKGIHKDDILVVLKEQAHIDLPEDALVLDEPIKEIGDHHIAVAVGDKSGSFTLTVSPEKK